MKKEPIVFIGHMLDSIELVKLYIKGRTKSEMFKSNELQDALVRRLEIIGEAGNNVSTEFRKKFPQIPWSDIVAMRNKLIHEYFIVDSEIVWQVIKQDLPKLEKDLKEILNKNES